MLTHNNSYQRHTFENGLDVVLKRVFYDLKAYADQGGDLDKKEEDDRKAYYNKRESPVCILLGLRMGSLYESAEMSGATHLIEHVTFFQTPASGSKKKHLQNLDWNGIDANGQTFPECLTMKLSCSSSETDGALWALYNSITAKKYFPDDFAAEKRNALREMDERHDDPRSYLEDWIFLPAMHKGTPLQKPILGTRETLQGFTPENLFAFRQQFFYPDNMVLVVVGDFNEGKIMKKIGETFATLPAAGKKAPRLLPYHPLSYHSPLEESRQDIKQTYIQTGWRVPGYAHKDNLPLYFLTQVLGGSLVLSSRLYSRLAMNAGYSYFFGAELESTPQAGIFSTHVAIAPEDEKKVIREIKKIFKDITARKITKAELEGVKSAVLNDVPRLEEVAKELFKHVEYGSKHDILSDAYKKCIKAITSEEILNAARKYFCHDPLTVVLHSSRTAKK